MGIVERIDFFNSGLEKNGFAYFCECKNRSDGIDLDILFATSTARALAKEWTPLCSQNSALRRVFRFDRTPNPRG